MKPSRYNVLVDDPTSGGLLVYNTSTGALSSFSAVEAPAARRLLERNDAGTTTDTALAAALREQRHLVEDDLDELEMVRARKRDGATDSTLLDVVVMPTLQCNFACGYCYETPRGSAMDESVQAALAAWLAREVPRHPLTILHWFGGEPLLHVDTVLRITHAAVAAAGPGRIVSPRVTTNGWLLDAATARRLVGAGILDYQVTIDGPPEVHDRMRVLRGGQGTFARIFDHVVGLLREHPETRLGLRCNFNETNLGRLVEVLRAFPADVRPRIRPAFEPIFGHCTLAASPRLPAGEIAGALEALAAEARRLGYQAAAALHSIEVGKVVYCYAERENQIVIAPDGDLFKCSACGFTEEDRVGRLRRDGTLERDEHRWRSWVAPDELAAKCLECTWLPLCMGGCRRVRLRQEAHEGTAKCTLIATKASHVLEMLATRGIGNLIARAGEGSS